MIRFAGVSFAYVRGRPVLDDLDLELGPGLTLLVGPNGSGKSSLLRLAAGVEAPDRGGITVAGVDLWRDEAAARRGLAYVPEQPDLTPYATLEEVLTLVCRLRGVPPQEGSAALARLGLAGCERRSVRELSLGQRRRAVLAAAQLGTPRHVLLDEPLETLDRGAGDELLAWMDALAAGGAVVVAASHRIEPFAGRAARVVALAPAGAAGLAGMAELSGAARLAGAPGLAGAAGARRCRLVEELPPEPAARLALLDRLARGIGG